MRNKKIWLAICLCGLLLGGCGKKQSSQQIAEATPEVTQSDTQQSGGLSEAGDDRQQTENGALSDASNAGGGDSSYNANNAEPTASADTGNAQAEPTASADTNDINQARTGGASSTDTNKARTGGASSTDTNKARTGNTSSTDTNTARTGSTSSTDMNKARTGDTSSTDTNKTKITKKEALATALKHAGIKESSLTAKSIKRDYEHGTAIYDVEFYANGKDYDYEIRISDGEILESDYEIADGLNRLRGSQSKNKITKSEAKKIALAKVPGAKRIHIEKDRENGRTVYEGEVYYEGKEYEFEIDASTGKILKWKVDND